MAFNVRYNESLHLSSVIAAVRDDVDVVRKVTTGVCLAVNVLLVWSVLVGVRNDEVSCLSSQMSAPQWKLLIINIIVIYFFYHLI